MKTLKTIGAYILLAVLAFATLFLIGYAAVIGQVWFSIITIGMIALLLTANNIIKRK